ncbi:MAG: aminopeptidase P family protein [Rhodospirillales bacterium]
MTPPDDQRPLESAELPSYAGDANLNRLLKKVGGAMTAAEARNLIAGVIAAPAAINPDAWMGLVTPRPGKNLHGQLRFLHAGMAQAAAEAAADSPAPAKRLSLLRAELKRRGLDGFIIPRGDEHQGEDVPACAERLAWLTGFTGSAGTALVTTKAAAVFTDGRYTLQTAKQVDGALYEIRHLASAPPEAWLAKNLAKGAKLGFDPWLHTENQAARLTAACARAGAVLTAVQDNPVDAVWAARPPRPIARAEPHPVRYTGRPAAEKRRRTARAVLEAEAAAVVLSAPDSIAWLLNIRGGDIPSSPLALCFAVLHRDAIVELFIDARKLTAAARAALGQGVTVREPAAVGAALDRLGRRKRRVMVQPHHTPVWMTRRLEAAGAVLVRAHDPCVRPKALKNKTEQAGMRACHVRDAAALCGFLAWLDGCAARGAQAGELELAARLEAFRREDPHYRGPSFPTISAAGPNAASPHYKPTPESDRALKKGSLYLVDSGGQYPDGTTDVTRTVAIGRPDNVMRDRFTRVLKGHIAVATARFPEGADGAALDPLARRALWDAGLDYDHGTGHGVGHYLCVHEGPQRISRAGGGAALEPGMVVSNEPGYYKAGAWGIRIENLVMVTPPGKPKGGERAMLGFETLTLAPIDRRLIAPSMLDAAETAWLDAYHARVMKKIGPRLDAGAREWLEKACRPLRT